MSADVAIGQTENGGYGARRDELGEGDEVAASAGEPGIDGLLCPHPNRRLELRDSARSKPGLDVRLHDSVPGS